MAAPSVPVFWPTEHGLHAPQTEYDNGLLIAYAETPDRIDNLKAGLAKQPAIHLKPCYDAISLAEAAQIHTPDLLNYILTAAQSLQDSESSYAYPSVFPGFFAHSPGMNARKVMGGMYAFDVHAPIGKGTAVSVFNSAGTAVSAAQSLIEENTRLVYALCRPPGHHAGRAFTGGYCYLNNAALAANRLKSLGKGAILDIDYHHGNGTQDIFWDDPDVFFASLHADPTFEYPYYTGYQDETGGKNALGTTANFPLPSGTDDTAYLTSLQAALSAIASFSPNWLVVSLGFDTFGGDPMSTFTLSQGIYRKIGREIGRLIRNLNLPTLLVQEGGYNISMLGQLANEFISGMTSIPSGEFQHAASID